MKFELKRLSPEAVPRALPKTERYRLRDEYDRTYFTGLICERQARLIMRDLT